MKRLCIGVVAHVDAGKTTLSEALLVRAGVLRAAGRVDHGDAYLDTDALEKARGITIFSKQAIIRRPACELTFVDTPGHVDFSGEMQRALGALDCAVLVVSAADGVQSHTRTLWRLLRYYQIPTMIFVNKTDLPNADCGRTRDALAALDARCVDFTAAASARDEAAALCDEALMEDYLRGGALSDASLARAISERALFPCFYGSALKLEGVDALLRALETLTIEPPRSAAFGARVIKISTDETGARLTHMKLTGGSLKPRAAIEYDGISEKATAVRIYSGAKYEAVEEAFAGSVCAVTGLAKTYAGQTLGSCESAPPPLLAPVLCYRVAAENEDADTLLRQLRALEQEDPLLHVRFEPSNAQISVRLMGAVQREVLGKLLLERFGADVRFSQGGVLYRETIEAPVEGVGHFEPLRHYAEVHLLLEPTEQGSGLAFSSALRGDALDRSFQKLILTHLAQREHPGVLTGAPITDMRITLIAGKSHLKHTEGGDFRQATYRAVRQGLKCARSVLLEPIYDVTLELPRGFVGRAMADVRRMNGQSDPPRADGETVVLSARVPVRDFEGYAAQLAAYTGGLGRVNCFVGGYAPAHDAPALIDSIGYDSESDTENPTGSVFCAHGAVFTVPWNEVRGHMHVGSGFRFAQDEPESAVRKKRSDEFRSALALDAELLSIFERTYGPVKREKKQRATAALQPPRAARSQPIPEGPEYLLVDGYNIIFAWDELRALTQENMDGARVQLIDRLCSYQGYCKNELILVFDAYRVKGGTGEVERHGGISVVYTKEAETADMYIEKTAHSLAKTRRVRVATSDGTEQIIILGQGARRVSATAFHDEVEAVEKEIREIIEGL
ncbi:MAG: translation factor GTPase family protein [Oscillospiraceae bacterium]|nr:translation factor GTPase family protein [Oscillospiraceae bacterium]